MHITTIHIVAIALSGIALPPMPIAVAATARCSLAPSRESPQRGTKAWIRNLIRFSEAVVRATAVASDSVPPAEADFRVPAGMLKRPEPFYPAVRFTIDEVIHGRALPKSLSLQGGLDKTDDFNDRSVPYTFVRPSGRSGSCFANSYRLGGHYILLLRLDSLEHWRLNSHPLAPINEQVHGASDPWVRWVRALFVASIR